MTLRLILGLIIISPVFVFAQIDGAERKREHALEAFEYLKTHDIQTGLIPKERLYQQMETLATTEESSNKTDLLGANDKWIELGPIDKGGRVKALAIVEYQGRDIALAGGAGGGLWRCEDISATKPYWRRVNDYFDNLNISCIVIHPTSSFIMYAATGDGWRNPVANPNDPEPAGSSLKGGGIWRSIDWGKTWVRVSSTSGSDFNYIQRMAFAPGGYLLVGTLTGLYKSTVGGAGAGGGTGASQVSQWTEMLALGGYLNKAVADIEISSNNDVFASTGVYTSSGQPNGTIMRLASNGGLWENINANLTIPCMHRVELASTPNQPNVLYASVSNNTGKFLGIYRSDNALATANTVSWTLLPDNPPIVNTGVSAFHNTLIVSPATSAGTPLNNIELYAGYEEIYRGKGGNANNNWTKISNTGVSSTIHVDQKLFVFEPGSSTKMYLCNDGGIYRTNNITAPVLTFSNISNNLFTMQFYTCAIDDNNQLYLGGAQDNQTVLFDVSGLSNGTTIGTGDGAYCHFDNTPNKYITSDQKMSIKALTNGTALHSYVYADFQATNPLNNPENWLFINPTELDKTNDILYVAGENNQIFRITNVFSSTPTIVEFQISNMDGKRASALKLSPNIPGLLYIGTEGGRILSLANANSIAGGAQTAVIKTVGACTCYVSSIDLKYVGAGLSDTELAYTQSNYGVTSILHTPNVTIGSPFSNIDNIGTGGFGDIPVRSVLFAPNGNTQLIKLLIGTDLGVFFTYTINGINTVWDKFPVNRGMPYVRVDMLKISPVDNMMLAGTFGRGMMRSDMFCTQHVDYSVSPQNAGSGCRITFQNTSTGYPVNYTKTWEVWHGATYESSYTGNTFSLDCWDLDMTVYLKLINPANGNVAIRVGKPLYSIITPGGGSCYNCINPFDKTDSGQSTTIYPNPSEDGLFYLKNGDKIKEGSIFDVNGRKILSFSQTETINIQNQASGVYFYQIIAQDGQTQTGKLVKK